MNGDLEELTTIVEKCFADVRQASIMFDIAWYANDQEGFPEALRGSPAGHTYHQIFSALMESSALALLRFLDNQNKAAHLDSFLREIEKPKIRNAILSEIRAWPTTPDEEYAKMELGNAMRDISNAKDRIDPHIKSLRRFRNSNLAHSQVKFIGYYPTFDEIRHVITECEEIAENMKRIVTGVITNIQKYRDIYQDSAEHFWRELITGLSTKSTP